MKQRLSKMMSFHLIQTYSDYILDEMASFHLKSNGVVDKCYSKTIYFTFLLKYLASFLCF